MTGETLTPKKGLGKIKSGEIFRLQKFMDERNLTPEAIHSSTGISIRTITHCLYDQNPIGIKLFRALHDIYGVSSDWLLSGKGQMLLSKNDHIAESDIDYPVGQNARAKQIIEFINDWMTYASENEQIWLETELKFKISQYKVFLKQKSEEQDEV